MILTTKKIFQFTYLDFITTIISYTTYFVTKLPNNSIIHQLFISTIYYRSSVNNNRFVIGGGVLQDVYIHLYIGITYVCYCYSMLLMHCYMLNFLNCYYTYTRMHIGIQQSTSKSELWKKNSCKSLMKYKKYFYYVYRYIQNTTYYTPIKVQLHVRIQQNISKLLQKNIRDCFLNKFNLNLSFWFQNFFFFVLLLTCIFSLFFHFLN